MKRNKLVHQGMPNRIAIKRAVGLFLALFGVLLLTQGISAAQTGDVPTPETESPPGVYHAPTDEELLAMPSAIERYLAAHTIPNGVIAAANLDGSTKSVSDDTVFPGGIFTYTITVMNSGGTDIPVTLTDELPSEVTYSVHTCPPIITTACGYQNGTVSWEGTAVAGQSVDITVTVVMNMDAVPGTVITNTAQLVSAEQNLEVGADVTVAENVAYLNQLLPIALRPNLGPITLAVGAPNGANTWMLSWTASYGATGYEIQESNSSNFDGATSIVIGPTTSHAVAKQPSPNNVFYYRARSVIGDVPGPWSNVVTVVGGYRDDFDDPSTGWGLRRGTHLEDVDAFYENGKYVTMITSRWDWLIASPLRPAPRVPYVIEYDARIISQGWVQSAGAVFGGDWGGGECPPNLTGEGWANHSNCFNHFYNINTIFDDTDSSNVKMKLIFERVDQVKWDTSGGAPLKRIGDIRDQPGQWGFFKQVSPRDWNHYRIEVRADSIRVYAATVGSPLKLQKEYTDTRWTTSPYFGFFTSTDLIEGATWRFEYIQVMPLDE